MCIILFIIIIFFYLLLINNSHHNISALRVRKLIIKRNSGASCALKADACKAN